ncbi:MAG: imidazolonepropionase [Pseudomonadota bacterium]
MLTDTAVGVADGVIRFVGALDELPAAMVDAVAQVVECEGALLTPGLIDAHTHLVYGGSRANEFEQRLSGVSYEAIARAGGGIRATVRATRDASEDQLVALARPRLAALMREGVTTVEIKSGYGLSTEHEVRMLRAAKRLAVEGINVVTTCLAAHAVPPEFDGNADGYIDYVCEDTLPAAAPYADAADAFCEGIAFSVAQVARYFDAATALGLPLRLHAEQLSDLGGAAMAAERGALSVDHLEYLSERGVAALAKHGTVATVLPGAFYTLRETQAPPVAALREAGVPMAVATDSNPGTSPVTSLLTTMNMACTLFGMTPTEAFDGVTCHAARALGRADTLGQIAPGFRADLVLWNAERPVDLCYPIGLNPCDRVWFGGVLRASEVVS